MPHLLAPGTTGDETERVLQEVLNGHIGASRLRKNRLCQFTPEGWVRQQVRGTVLPSPHQT